MEVPFALSINKFVNSVGADAGFAAFVCVAVIGLLYFAQARETASLRDRLEDAHERIGGLEARIAQLMHLQSRQPVRQQPQPPAPAPGRVTPPPAGARPMGSAIASVRRIPAATATASAPAVAAAVEPGTPFPVAPAGMGAPALASATKLIPDPAPIPAAASAAAVAPDDTMFVPGAAVTPAAANGKGEAPAPAAAAPAVPRAVMAPTPPRVQIGSDAALISPSSSSSRSTEASAARPVGEARFDLFEQGRGGSRFGSRRLPLAIASVAVVVIIGGVVAILQSGGTTTSSNVNSPTTSTTATSTSTSGSHKGKKHKVPVFAASSVTVAVLNGTAVNGLAADVAKVLSGAGYKKGSITNAPTQTEATTIVYFRPGYKADAQHVARQLKLSSSRVESATQAAIQACATTPTAATTSCTANVIVSVGQDKASLASSASAG
jgi:hypothetical protein